MPVEIKWKLRAAAFSRVLRMLQDPALGVCWVVWDQSWEVSATHCAKLWCTKQIN